MTIVPLAQLRLRPGHHRSALWWVWTLYRQPIRTKQEFEVLAPENALLICAVLCIHALPYLVLLSGLGRLLLLVMFGVDQEVEPLEVFLAISSQVTQGVAAFFIVALTFGIAGAFADAVALGIVGGIICGIAGVVWLWIAFVVAIVRWLEIPCVLAFAIAVLVPVPVAFVMAVEKILEVYYVDFFDVRLGLVAGLPIGLIFSQYIFHLFFILPTPKGHWYRFHPVSWTGVPMSFPGLCSLLVAYAAVNHRAAETEIEHLVNHYPSQRREAFKARAILIAQATRDRPILSRLDLAVASLPEGERGFLRDVPRLKAMVAEVSQLHRRLETVQVPAFREPLAAELVRAIRDFRDGVAGLRYPLNTAFREAALAWLEVAEGEQAQERRILEERPVTQVFRAGDPVQRSQEAFVPRMRIIEELQGQITLATGCPGLLLYGRRRMGKSTLISNLQPFLPTPISVAWLSMQDPRALTTLEQWAGSVARCSAQAAGTDDPGSCDLSGLFLWLGELDTRLESDGRRVLLCIDEYENIDRKLGERVFTVDLLDTVRESIQRHRRLTWLFAGSHALAELSHTEWSSWFVSLRTVEIPCFSSSETHQLLTEPMRYSDLWRDNDVSRPRFDAAFWGEHGIELIHGESAGWPHLVQLLAERAVYLVNLRGLRACTPQILGEAIASAISSGDVVLRHLVYNESQLPGEWKYLKNFRTRELQPPPEDEAVYQSLQRRLMVVDVGGQWRMRVPLMQRWLRDRG